MIFVKSLIGLSGIFLRTLDKYHQLRIIFYTVHNNKDKRIEREPMKKRFFLSLLLLLVFGLFPAVSVRGEELSIQSPSAILMEASTGTVIYENNPDERLSPASITKIMTLLLIFDALEENRITLADKVVTSAYAKSMGGSQVFLEEGEEQTVETLIKCIAVASGNDASVAMAEHLSGSEAAFVEEMNKKVHELGLENTHFVDCSGLSDSDDHYTTARDVALISRELITEYPEIFNYTTIWMEDIIHRTNKGESTFTLSSTNKLLKQYPYANGLKTGSTSKAKFCLAATALKENIQLISVVMAAPDSHSRLKDSEALLNYGFAKARYYEDTGEGDFAPLTVEGGVLEELPVSREGSFQYLDTEGNDLSLIRKEDRLPEMITAPINKGDKVGETVYFLADKKIGSVPVVADITVEKATFKDTFKSSFGKWLLGKEKL